MLQISFLSLYEGRGERETLRVSSVNEGSGNHDQVIVTLQQPWPDASPTAKPTSTQGNKHRLLRMKYRCLRKIAGGFLT